MPIQSAPRVRPFSRALRRSSFLVSVSATALVLSLAGGKVMAQPLGARSSASAPDLAGVAAAAAAQQAAAVAKQAQAALLRTTPALQAMQAAQAAARAAAGNASATLPTVTVSNGLAPGGLVPDSGLP